MSSSSRRPVPVRASKKLGDDAEALIASHLASQGFAILGRNVRVGRLEIDLIARRGSTVIFVEVRARSNDRIAAPFESIDRMKIARVRRAAALWLGAAKLGPIDARFDVASVVFDCPGGRVDYFEDAF
jgi:putative endonuclease